MRKQQKRDAILGAAMTLFSRHGYHAVGVDRIVEASGASKMTLYKHFETKENLIIEVLRMRDRVFADSLRKSVMEADGGLSKVKAIFDWHIEWFRQESFHGCMFIKAAEEFELENEEIMSVARNHKMVVRDLLAEALSGTKIRDHGALADFLLVILEGMIVTAHMFGPDGSVEKVWRKLEPMLQSQQEES